MKRLPILSAILVVFTSLAPPIIYAQYSSPNYKVEETFFGAGGEVESTSPSYKAQSSVGSLGVGIYGSTNFKAHTGFLTPGDPFLEMVVNTSTVNLGDLDLSSAKTGTSTFQVRAYTDSGYTVATVSQPPKTSTGYTLTGMPLGVSSPGTEQFGINLRANTSPATFGADPSPQPDSSFADGQAAAGYNTVNQFKYSQGDIIAQTNTSGWGLTIFTISYLANISAITKAGAYSMTHDLVTVATY